MGKSSENRSVVWVTGAAGGIGRAVVDAFNASGAKVVATDVRSDRLPDAERAFPCDVSNEADIASVISSCSELGGIDVLVNCAGTIRRLDVFEVSPAIWDLIFDVNVRGPFLCSQAVSRAMIADGRRGAIVNIGSVNAEKVFPDTIAYCSSKGALHAMTRAMALALAPYGIRVNTVAPGAIANTDLESVRWADPAERLRMERMTPIGRVGAAEDIAPAVVFLSSAAATFITGATLFVDGGRTASV